MSPAVFFDRDDTLIENKHYLNDPDKVVYLPNAFTAVKELQDNGYKIIIVTNQSGVPRGIVQLDQLAAIHDKMQKDYAEQGVDILAFYYSPHLPGSDHPTRKPNPGMLLQAAEDHDIDLKKSWMVGDRFSDVEAGKRAGTKSILLLGNEDLDKPEFDPPEYTAENLEEVKEIILT